jgi:hypothetical protein
VPEFALSLDPCSNGGMMSTVGSRIEKKFQDAVCGFTLNR